MRKIVGFVGLVGGLLLTLALTAVPAMGQAKYPPQPPENPTVIERGGGTDGGTDGGAEGIAFTGQDFTLLMIVIGVLVVVGVVALLAARRRAASAATG
jgi:hypothetical protein